MKLYYNPNIIEAGCDEVGRGCLAGPVYAAAVILPKKFPCQYLKDSKKLSPSQRIHLEALIKSEALTWSIGTCSPKEIDRYNILQASIRAMHKALRKLNISPGHILVDGNQFNNYCDIPHTCIIKGDNQYASIAAASIIAKTARDRYMTRLHNKHPIYGWDQNKGYPTRLHREAIATHNICSQHRLSFKLMAD